MLLKMGTKLSLLLVCIMLFSTINVFAKETNNFEIQKEKLLSTIDISEEIDNALNGISDESISEDLVNQVRVEATFIPVNPYRNNFEDIDYGYTIKKVGEIVSENGNIDTMYALTTFAKVKTSSNSETEASVDSYITLVWIDNLGINNELTAVKGSWTPNGQILSDRCVSYGVDGIFESENEKYPTTNAFNYSTSLSGLTFTGKSNVEVDGYGRIGILVVTSIFD